MRKQRLIAWSSSLVVAGLATIAIYSSCGTTGGGNDPIAATSQFFSLSCAPAGPFGGGSCLSLQTPSSVPADGTTVSGFRARLVDGSGAPLPGVQICFAFEDPLVATIIEPTDACGLTDQDGRVSGQFRDGVNPGSFALVATPQAGFALQIRRTIRFVGVGGGGGGGGGGGQGCTTGSDCPSGQCSSNSDICGEGLGACCLSGSGDPCSGNDAECAAGLQCISGSCRAANTPTVPPANTPTPASTPVPVGESCGTSAQCVDGNRCSSTFLGCVFDACCTGSGGDACSDDSQCDTNSCVAGSCT